MNELNDAIREASDAKRVVRYSRDGLDYEGEDSYGYVVALSDEWLVTHYVADHLRLDGYDAVRISDLTDFTTECDRATFLDQCVKMKEQAPVLPQGIRAESARDLLESIVEHFPVVMLHREHVSPDECELGTLKMVSDESYALRWMTPTAEWEDDETIYRFDDVTRVTFGSEYETTLAGVAGLIEWGPKS
jgi:hypothetical protein